MHSKLTNKIMLADPSNYTVGRQGYKICKITPHHMAAIWSAERCAQSFQNPNRNASANYCIGSDGTIVCNVAEENRAWTSSNGVNDCQAITFEIANITGAPTWEISDKAWKATVNLCVDICRRYGFRLNFNGTPSGSLTMHKMFAATSCPGPYLEPRMKQLEKEVNAILEGGKPVEPSKPISSNPRKKNGYLKVIYKGSDGLVLHNKPSWDVSTESGVVHDGVYTIVDGQDVDGFWMYKIKSGKWITSAPEYVQWIESIKPQEQPTPPKKSIDEIAREVIQGKWGNGQDRVNRLTSAGYNATQVQNKVNELAGASNKKSIDTVAREVIRGEWGNGQDRVNRLRAAGYDPVAVQNKVNQLM
ncbi:MAG: N-acetylmuramoyl-L-alanine amidase [Porphyromonadaceae bacterium]|nr:N-acetylmuramoyl-L-alanine amidase [Porphyromonadaceae bacterium]